MNTSCVACELKAPSVYMSYLDIGQGRKLVVKAPSQTKLKAKLKEIRMKSFLEVEGDSIRELFESGKSDDLSLVKVRKYKRKNKKGVPAVSYTLRFSTSDLREYRTTLQADPGTGEVMWDHSYTLDAL